MNDLGIVWVYLSRRVCARKFEKMTFYIQICPAPLPHLHCPKKVIPFSNSSGRPTEVGGAHFSIPGAFTVPHTHKWGGRRTMSFRKQTKTPMSSKTRPKMLHFSDKKFDSCRLETSKSTYFASSGGCVACAKQHFERKIISRLRQNFCDEIWSQWQNWVVFYLSSERLNSIKILRLFVLGTKHTAWLEVVSGTQNKLFHEFCTNLARAWMELEPRALPHWGRWSPMQCKDEEQAQYFRLELRVSCRVVLRFLAVELYWNFVHHSTLCAVF